MMKLSKSNIIQGVGWLIITIVVSAIGSGVWENIFKPTITSIQNTILDITTFGINRYRNDIYCEIAKGFCEKASVSLLCLVVLTFSGFLMATVITVFAANGIKKITPSGRYRKVFLYASTLYMIIFSVFATFYAARISYINSATTYFYQCRSIILPHIKQEEEKKLDAKFSQIWSKDDYVTIMSNVETIAAKNNQRLPKFKIW